MQQLYLPQGYHIHQKLIMYFLAIVCYLTVNVSYAQASLIAAGQYRYFQQDNFGNFYLVNAQNQIKKVNAKGDSLAIYNDVRRFGDITLIDATNPLQVLVWYKDFQTIVVLDRFLNMQTAIDLRKQGLFQVSCIALSYDGNIWLYNELGGNILKINDAGTPLLTSADVRQALQAAPSMQFIADNAGKLCMYDSATGWWIFDYYGAFAKHLPYKNLKFVQVTNQGLWGVEQGQWLQLKTDNPIPAAVPLPQGIINQAIQLQRYLQGWVYLDAKGLWLLPQR